MAYIDRAFYDEVFNGTTIPEKDFNRLADIASEIVQSLCTVELRNEDLESDTFKKAVAFQVELLFDQGGINTILGQSEAAHGSGSESLGDYSVSAGASDQASLKMHNGIPVSPMTLMLLERLGLLSRWAYAEYYRRRCHGKS